jgi:uracil-DNA glycosylase family 4
VLTKPKECRGCVLFEKGTAFAPAVGSRSSLLCFVGEALGRTEAIKGEPFVGDAGVYLNRAFRRLGIERPQQRIGNVISCQPPNDWLRGAPWEKAAIAQCYTHRRQQIQGHKVYVTLGVTATETILKELLGIEYAGQLENWHGYVLGNESAGWVVPTFHPAFLLRGNQKLFGTFLHDITRAMEVADSGFVHDQVFTLEDPGPAAFANYVTSIPDDPDFWMAVDIENPSKGVDEGDLAPGFAKTSITRISFAFHPDQGVSVPFEPRYYDLIRAALAKGCAKIFHNWLHDVPILEGNGFPVAGTILDSMWAWHMLQSDTKKGLGFVAPFYSRLPPWKHLDSIRPAYYNAIDSIQCLRIMTGIADHLQKYGQWKPFLRYCVRLDRQALFPMTKVGVRMDREALKKLEKGIDEELRRIKIQLTDMYPKELIPPEGGWKRQPKIDSPYRHAAYKATVKEKVLCCEDCGEEDVTQKHKCKESDT